MNGKGLIVVALISFFLIDFCFAQNQENGIVQVVGKATIKATPEDFVITIPISVSDSLYEQCSNGLISKLNKIQNDLKGIGFDSKVVKTLDLSILEDFYYDKGRRMNSGFKGSAVLQITDKYSAEKLGNIISILKGRKSLYTLTFKLSNSQIEKLNAEVISSAVEDGSKKVRLLAKAAGIILGRIQKITYDYTYFGNDPLVREEVFASEAMPQETQNLNLSPKDISIDKKVVIEWSIKQ